MMSRHPVAEAVIRRAAGCLFFVASLAVSAATEVVVDPGDPPLIKLAGREVRRYVYLRSDILLDIVPKAAAGREVIRLRADSSLKKEEIRLKTSRNADGARVLELAGGSDVAVLYAAYRFAEAIGIRFYLHGDVVPDKKVPWVLPQLDLTELPLFATRGLLPFHDFTQGPDWWELDDYKGHFAQMVKMRMNFMGLHCYPEGPAGPEPLVWIGHPDDVDRKGNVSFSAPSMWASTAGGAWGYGAIPTGSFAAGAGNLFEDDVFGPSVTKGHRPKPTSLAGSNEVFNRAGELFSEAFGYGRRMGVRIGVGTETPLHIPESVKARLREKGLDPEADGVKRKVYEGMFTRIARKYPVDLYWLWTPESWTWNAPQPSAIQAVVQDLRTALEAHANVGRPFRFGTNGWELGPRSDRSLFDNLLPKDAVMSCINRNIGFNWVDPEFLRIKHRPKWAIPWLEDDSAMVLPQLWAGRIRRDAADALSYGCSGLLGIHWRSKTPSPNLSALAQAAWSQDGWNPDIGKRAATPEVPTTDVRVGGDAARSDIDVSQTKDDPIYQDCRYGMSAYRIAIPNGTYDVTLKFCEIGYDAPGKRVFGVEVEGKPLVEKLDLAEAAGRHAAYDLVARTVRVVDEELNIDFLPLIEHPLVSAIVIQGRTDDFNQFKSRPYSRLINCGGGKWNRYEADLGSDELPPAGARVRDLSCVDFYQDLAAAWFGPEAAPELAAFFTRYDGDGGASGVVQGRATLPRPNTWLYGPGAIVADRTPWELASKQYAFVDELSRVRSKIKNPGDLERFDYWHSSFVYLRSVHRVACARGALDAAMERLKGGTEPADHKRVAESEVLPMRVALAREWEAMMTSLLQTVDTPGGLGTVANLEQSTRIGLKFVEGHDADLVQSLGVPLPPEATVSTAYRGKPRIIVPCARSVVSAGERVRLKVIVLDREPPVGLRLSWRRLGVKRVTDFPLQHIARGVYQVTLPEVPAEGAEYWIHVRTAKGASLVWPSTAPNINHTLTQMP